MGNWKCYVFIFESSGHYADIYYWDAMWSILRKHCLNKRIGGRSETFVIFDSPLIGSGCCLRKGMS
jgi:hypothetical protein